MSSIPPEHAEGDLPQDPTSESPAPDFGSKEHIADLIVRINEAIEAKKFLNKTLAVQAGLSPQHLSNWRKGQRNLSRDALEVVEETLNTLCQQSRQRQPVRAHLLEQVRKHFATIDLRFLLPDQYVPDMEWVSIDRVFIEPRLVPVNQLHSEGTSIRELLPNLTLIGRPVLHIVAPAGSGKSTCLRQLVATTEVEGTTDPLPVVYPLSDLNHNLGPREHADESDLMDYIAAWYRHPSRHDISAEIRSQVESGTALFLLDGLDEVTNAQGRRRRAVALINRFSATYGTDGNRVIVTERGAPPFGRLDRLGRSVAYTFEPFGLEEAKRLIHNWYELFADGSIDAGQHEIRDPERLTTSLERPPLDKLTHTPLLLTLVAVLYYMEGALVGPASAPIFQRFFDLALDIWQQERSFDSDRPIPKEFSQHRAQQDILMYIAWEVGTSRLGTREEMPGAQVRKVVARRLARHDNKDYDALDGYALQLLNDRVDAFLSEMLAAGILVRKLSRTGRRSQRELFLFGIHEQLVLTWFKAALMLAEPPRLERVLKRAVDDPFQCKWHTPLGYVASIWVERGQDDLVARTIDHALAGRAVGELLKDLGLPEDTFYKIMPLGLMLAREILEDLPQEHEDDAEQGPFHAEYVKVTTAYRRFYEATDYAVVTVAMQPWAAANVALLNLYAEGDLRIPATPDEVSAWIGHSRSLDDDTFVAQADRIWRYQTHLSSFHRLINAVVDRFERDTKPRQKLMRRLVFGMRFVSLEDARECIKRLEHIEMRFGDDRVVRDMANHTRAMLEEGLFNLVQQRLRDSKTPLKLEPPEPTSAELESWPADRFYRLLPPHLFTLIRDDEFAAKVFQAAEKVFGAEGDALVEKLRDQLDLHDGDVAVQQWDRAAAAVMLGKFLKTREPQEIRKDGKYWEVVLALAKVANAKEHFTSVSACQLYDYAAWAIRCAFLRVGFEEDISLPLLPGSSPPPD